MPGIGPHAGHLLCLFGERVHAAWGYTPYQVGSSLLSRGDWRDVDVRLILPDKAWAAYFGGLRDPETAVRMYNLAWSIFGQRLTGLPVDFQVQALSAANAIEGPRSALFLLSRSALNENTETGTEETDGDA